MVTKRRRFKQTMTLAQRLSEEASRLRDRARTLPPGPEQAQLLRKVRQAEAALRIDQWLASSGDAPPTKMTPSIRKSQKGPSSTSSHGSS